MALWTMMDFAGLTGSSGGGRRIGPFALRSKNHIHRREILNAVSSSHSIKPSMRGFRWRTVVPSMSKITIVGRGSVVIVLILNTGYACVILFYGLRPSFTDFVRLAVARYNFKNVVLKSPFVYIADKLLLLP